MLALLLGLALQLHTMKQVRVIPLRGELHHVQGIEVDQGILWVSSVDQAERVGWLHRFDLPSGRLRQRIRVDEGDRYHPGGIALDGDSIWVPVAEYHRGGKTTMQRRDKRTLAMRSSFVVDDHIGSVAAGANGLVGGNWDSLLLYEWTRGGRLLRRRENPARAAYQDMKIVDGQLVASGNLSRDLGAIDWIDLDRLRLLRRVTAGKTDRGVRYTNEGMAVRGDRLYLLPEDGPSRLFVFDLEALLGAIE